MEVVTIQQHHTEMRLFDEHLRRESDERMERYLGIIHEENREMMKAVTEQFVDVNRKLDSHERILNSHTEMIGQILVDTAEVKTILGTHDKRISDLEKAN